MSKNNERPSRRLALLGDRPGSYAIARHVRMSPMKVRRVVNLVRGMDVEDALDLLKYAPQAASEPIFKCVASAVANAENTEALQGDDLYISQIFVDEGIDMRRIRPRAKGSASRIMKRSSHITVVVEPKDSRPAPKKARKAQVKADVVAEEPITETPAEKVDAKKADAKKVDAKKSDAKKVDSEKVDAEKADSKKADAKTKSESESEKGA